MTTSEETAPRLGLRNAAHEDEQIERAFEALIREISTIEDCVRNLNVRSRNSSAKIDRSELD
jgi:hypothetical protein